MTSNWREVLQNALSGQNVDVADVSPSEWRWQPADALEKIKNVRQSDFENAGSWLSQEIPRGWSAVANKANDVKCDIKKDFAPIIAWLKSVDVARVVYEDALPAILAVDGYTRRHPYRTGLPLVLFFGPKLIWVVDIISQLVLYALGFRNRGIARGSFAAGYESQNYTYGSDGIPRRSTFAHMQSAGARGSPSAGLIDMALGVWGVYILKRHFMG